MMKTIRNLIRDFSRYIAKIDSVETELFHEQLRNKIEEIDNLSQKIAYDEKKELMNYCFDITAEEFDQSNIFSSARHKPFGYAGDFLIIDWIYQKMNNSPGKGKLWDNLFHRDMAATAVRNRKDFFIEKFQKFNKDKNGVFSALDLACGPSRDLLEAVKGLGGGGQFFHCVDMEERALSYSQELFNKHSLNINIIFERQNILRLKPEQQYDLIYAAGIFDYLPDKLAIALIKRMWHWAKSGGTVIFGNFHPNNKTKNIMDWCLDWHLIHRTEDELENLCRKAGIPLNNLTLEFEPSRVNLFAVLQK